MNATEIRAWLETRPQRFKEILSSHTWAASDAAAQHGFLRSQHRECRRETRLFLRGGLYADGHHPDPDCLNEVLDQLEREA